MNTSNPEREAEAHQAYQALFEPIIRHWEPAIRKHYPNPTLLDAGCGEGYFSLHIGNTLGANRLILTDRANILAVPLPQNAEFHQLDMCSPQFRQQFHGQPDVLICMEAFHQLQYPIQGVTNLFSVLRQGAIGLLFDYSESGWSRRRKEAKYAAAYASAKVTGVDTDAGIRHFWEQRVFPGVPGHTILSFHGEFYMVSYLSWNWGKFKKAPVPLAREALRQAGLIS